MEPRILFEHLDRVADQYRSNAVQGSLVNKSSYDKEVAGLKENVIVINETKNNESISEKLALVDEEENATNEQTTNESILEDPIAETESKDDSIIEKLIFDDEKEYENSLAESQAIAKCSYTRNSAEASSSASKLPLLSLRTLAKTPALLVGLLIVLVFGMTPYLSNIVGFDADRFIAADLVYGDHPNYDTDNDGIESISGVVDVQMHTVFNWNVNTSYLVTLWTIHDENSETTHTVCFGSEKACGVVNHSSTLQHWNQSLTLYYDRWGASHTNTVSSQVVYANYSQQQIQIIRSEELNRSVIFTQPTPKTLPVCVLPNVTLIKNEQFTLHLSKYCSSYDESITSSYYETPDLEIEFEEGTATITPAQNFTGTTFTFFTWTTEQSSTSSNIFSIEVKDREEFVEVGKPVIRTKKVVLNGTSAAITLPADIINVTIANITATTTISLDQNRTPIETNEYNDAKKIEQNKETIALLKDAEKQGAERVSLDGQNLTRTDIRSKIHELEQHESSVDSLATLTALQATAEDVDEKNVTVFVDNVIDNVSTITVEYTQPSPIAIETPTETGKLIDIISPTHYENVLISTPIPETSQDSISVYWHLNDTKQAIEDLTYIDSNHNGHIDIIEWVIPHLSNQTFSVDINILTVQSYPLVGGLWKTEFNTTGSAPLTIRGVNGTTFSELEQDNPSTNDDLVPISLSCGNTLLFHYSSRIQAPGVFLLDHHNNSLSINQTVEQSTPISALTITNYTCDQTSEWVVRVQTKGKHAQEFDYGGLFGYAHNDAQENAAWWNTTFGHRTYVLIKNNYSDVLPANFTVRVPAALFNATDLVNKGRLTVNGSDIRVVDNESNEVYRVYDDYEGSLYFKTGSDIPAQGNSSYYIYYGRNDTSYNQTTINHAMLSYYVKWSSSSAGDNFIVGYPGNASHEVNLQVSGSNSADGTYHRSGQDFNEFTNQMSTSTQVSRFLTNRPIMLQRGPLIATTNREGISFAPSIDNPGSTGKIYTALSAGTTNDAYPGDPHTQRVIMVLNPSPSETVRYTVRRYDGTDIAVSQTLGPEAFTFYDSGDGVTAAVYNIFANNTVFVDAKMGDEPQSRDVHSWPLAVNSSTGGRLGTLFFYTQARRVRVINPTDEIAGITITDLTDGSDNNAFTVDPESTADDTGPTSDTNHIIKLESNVSILAQYGWISATAVGDSSEHLADRYTGRWTGQHFTFYSDDDGSGYLSVAVSLFDNTQVTWHDGTTSVITNAGESASDLYDVADQLRNITADKPVYIMNDFDQNAGNGWAYATPIELDWGHAPVVLEKQEQSVSGVIWTLTSENINEGLNTNQSNLSITITAITNVDSVNVTCISGNCSNFTFDRPPDIMNADDISSINFTCADSVVDTYSATFLVNSTQNPIGDSLTLSCTIFQTYGSINVTILTPTPLSETNVFKDKFFDLNATVTCVGTPGAICGNISANSRHNGGSDSVADIGTGADGALTVTSADEVVNSYAYITADASAGATTLSVNDVSAFSQGQEVLIVQIQNGSSTCRAGDYEFATISSVGASSITLTAATENDYCHNNPVETEVVSGENPTAGTHVSAVAQVVTVPHYTTVTVNSGASLTAPHWNGTRGGIVAFRATGTVTTTGPVNVSSKGFRGGAVYSPGNVDDGGQGEGYTGWGIQGAIASDDGRGFRNNIGGGGSIAVSNDGGDGAAGGGHATAGQGTQTDFDPSQQDPDPEEGGDTVGNGSLVTMFFGGGGGGGSDSDDASCNQNVFAGDAAPASLPNLCQRGGLGGGIVFIVATTFAGARIDAAGHSIDPVWDGGPGGGAGGTIWLRADDITLTHVNAIGGPSVCDYKSSGADCGGAGGEGRIRLDYNTVSGSSFPGAGFNGSAPILSSSSSFILVNTTAGETPFYTVSLQPQSCVLQPSQSCQMNWSINATGTHFFTYTLDVNATSNNTLVLANVSLNTTVRVIEDTTPPQAIVTSIIPNPANHSLNNVSINWTVTEEYLLESFLNVSWPNGSLFGLFYDNITLTPKNLTVRGNYTATAYAIDGAMNVNFTVYYFELLDVLPPNVTLIGPPNLSFDTDGDVNFTFIVEDASDNMSCALFFSSVPSPLLVNTSVNKNITQQMEFTGLGQGVYNWFVNCTDPQLLIGKSAEYNFTVDTENPVVTLAYPQNDTWNNTGSIQFSYNVTDTNLQHCELYHNNTGTWQLNQTDTSMTSGAQNYFNQTVLRDSGTSWNVRCVDFSTRSDWGSSDGSGDENFTINIDTHPPHIVFSDPTPVNNTNQSSTSLLINVSHLENNTHSVVLYFNGTLNQTKTYTIDTNHTNFSLSLLEDGTYTYYVEINDSAANVNTTENRTIRIDTVPPQVTLSLPLNDTWRNNASTTVLFTYTPFDITTSVLNCSLGLNETVNQTNHTIAQGQENNFSVTFLQGFYNWSIACVDGVDLVNSTEERLLKVDTEFPRISNENISGSSFDVNDLICLNVSIQDSVSLVDRVFVTVDFPDSGPTNVTLNNATGGCGNAGGDVWSYELLLEEKGTYVWAITYAFDIAQNLNVTSPDNSIQWTVTSDNELTTALLLPTTAIEINESGQNNNFSMQCGVSCTLGTCSNTTLQAQFSNGTFNLMNPNSSTMYLNLHNVSCGNLTAAGSGWWNNSYSYRMQLTINNSGRNETLYNFTTLVKLTSSRFTYANALQSGDDLRFIDEDGQTMLSYHYENWDYGGDSFIWVKVPEIKADNGSEYIWLYYGSADATNVRNTSESYDSFTQFVSHFNGTADDLSQNYYAATTTGTPDQELTPVGYGYNFDESDGGGTGEYFSYGDTQTIENQPQLTLEAYIHTDSTDGDDMILSKRSTSTQPYLLFWRDETATGGSGRTETFSFTAFAGSGTRYEASTNSMSDTDWHYLAVVFNGSDSDSSERLRGYIDGYEDGVSPEPTTSTVTPDNADPLVVGRWLFATSYNFDGTITEIRLSNTSRSKQWINASHHSFQDSLIGYGAEEPFSYQCLANFSVTSRPDAGNDVYPIRCVARSATAAIDFSEQENVTINDHPVANFTYPSDGDFLHGVEVLNASSSFDLDGNITDYLFELDTTTAFTSPITLCQSNLSNCTFDTVAQSECVEESTSCYLRLNVTENDGLQNSTVLQIGIDNVGPNATLDRPFNLTNISTNYMVNATIVDAGSGIDTAFFYYRIEGELNWNAACNDSDQTPPYNCTWDITGLTDSNKYEFLVFANDTEGNVGINSSHANITVDQSPPIIRQVRPENDTWSRENVTFTVNASDYQREIDSCSIVINESVNQTDFSIFQNTTKDFEVNNIADGYYFWQFSCNDTLGNTNISHNYTIKIDNTAPTVTILEPGPFENISATSYTLNASVIDVGIGVRFTTFEYRSTDFGSWISVCDDFDATDNLFNCTWDTGALPELNTYQIRAYSNDSFNFTSDIINVTNISLDRTPPNVSLTQPANHSQDTDGNIQFIYNVTDILLGIRNCTLFINDSANITSTPIENENQFFNPSTLNDGTYNWTVGCYDSAHNFFAPYPLNFTVGPDITPPQIVLSAPINNSVYGSTDVDFQFNVTDLSSDILSCTIIINGKKNTSNTSVLSETAVNTITVNDISEAEYNWSVNCTDASVAANEGTAPFFNISIVPQSGAIRVTLLNPPEQQVIQVYYNRTFVVRANISCDGQVGISCGNISAFARRNTTSNASLLGSGLDGNGLITAASTIVNNYTQITNQSLDPGHTVIGVNDGTEFSSGDEILVIQMQDNETSNYSGVYEFVEIQSVNGNAITLANPLVRTYRSGLQSQINASAAQIVRVAQYQNLIIQTGASIVAPAWNGVVGGIVVVRSQNNITFEGTGTINVNQLGFRGGAVGFANNEPGTGGEGHLGLGELGDTNPGPFYAYNNNSGGTGGRGTSDCGGGGGGGGHAAQGDEGNNNIATGSDEAYGGFAVGDSVLSHIFLGGGGGGGGDDDSAGTDADGGDGGGIAYLVANRVESASITSNGETKTDTNGCGSAEGSGGAGGTIYIAAVSIDISSVTASGGSGAGTPGSNGHGGDGSDGRIRLDYSSLSGSPSPLPGHEGAALSFESFTAITTVANQTPMWSYTSQPQWCVLDQGEYCEVNWTVNATGDFGSAHLIDVNISSSEVLVAANKSLNGTVNITLDTDNPVIQLVTPNESWTQHNLTLEFIPYDESPIINCSVILNTALNETTDIVNENTNNNFSLVNMAEGAYSWTINCTDFELNVGTNDTPYVFYVDRSAPTINLTSPIDRLNTSSSTVSLNFTAFDNLDRFLTCNVTLDSVINGTVEAPNGTNANLTVTGLNDGTHVWNVTCIDNATNMATSNSFQFFVDTVPPQIQLNRPFNDSWFALNSMDFNYTPQDALLDTCELYGNFSNTWERQAIHSPAVSGQPNIFNGIDLKDGTFIWNVNCSDQSGNSNFSSSNYTIQIDTQNPHIAFELPTPENGTNTSQNSFFVNVSFSENSTEQIFFYLNGTLNITKNYGYAENHTNFTISDLPEGRYTYHLELNDSADNKNTTQNRTITVDLSPPRITPSIPANDTWRSNSTNNISFIYSAVDMVTTVQNCSLYINAAHNQTNGPIVAETLTNFTQWLPEGFYNWSIQCADDVSNLNSTLSRLVKVDQGFPLSRNESINRTNASIDEYTCLNLTATDDLSGVGTVLAEITLPISGPTNYTLTNATSECGGVGGSSYSYSFINQESGTHNWTAVYVIDIAGNTNITLFSEGLIWNVTGESEMGVTLTTPAENIRINESDSGNTYVQRCDAQCTSGICNNVTLLVQYNNGSFSQITPDSSDLVNEVTNASCGNLVAPGANWFDTSWNNRMKLNFNYTGPENLENFTFMIRLTTTNFDYSGVRSDGGDLRFVDDDDSTVLPYHFERWTYNGESIVWVKVTEIDADSTSDFIYLYYNNSLATLIENESNTYDVNYSGVWHMHTEDTQVNDSTKNQIDLSEHATPGYENTGKIGYAAEFSGTGSNGGGDADSFEVLNQGPLATEHTLEAWIYPHDTSDREGFGRGIWSYSSPSNSEYSAWYTVSDNEIEVESYETDTGQFFTTSTSGSITDNNWHHVAITSVRGGTTSIYINGEFAGSYTNDGDNGANSGFTIGDLRFGSCH